MSKKILIAKILSAHGIKGEVKMIIFTDNQTNIEQYKLFDNNNNSFSVKISNKSKNFITTNKNGDKIIIAKIQNIIDRNQAENIRGLELYVDRQDFKKTNNNEFYINDLLNLIVRNTKLEIIGRVINVLNYPSGALIEIEFEENSIPNGWQKISNFPFKNAFFPTVNIDDNYLVLDVYEIV